MVVVAAQASEVLRKVLMYPSSLDLVITSLADAIVRGIDTMLG